MITQSLETAIIQWLIPAGFNKRGTNSTKPLPAFKAWKENAMTTEELRETPLQFKGANSVLSAGLMWLSAINQRYKGMYSCRHGRS